MVSSRVPPADSQGREGVSDKIWAAAGLEFIGRAPGPWLGMPTSPAWGYPKGDAGINQRDTSSYMALDDEAVSRIKGANPQLEKKSFVTPRSDRPKMYVMCGTVLAPLNYLATSENAVSFQQSPDFIGSPFYPNDQQVDYHKATICPNGFVESFAYGGEAPPGEGQSGGEAVAVGEPQAPWALPYAVGTSHLTAWLGALGRSW
eukprot:Skav227681  [mRNA]  locus=scaffold2108:102535:107006:- [translate_table: standard]